MDALHDESAHLDVIGRDPEHLLLGGVRRPEDRYDGGVDVACLVAGECGHVVRAPLEGERLADQTRSSYVPGQICTRSPASACATAAPIVVKSALPHCAPSSSTT